MNSCTNAVISLVLDAWQPIALAMLLCIVSGILADVLKLNRPWPLAAILAAIMTKILFDAFPCEEILFGDYTFIPIWIILTAVAYCPDRFVGRTSQSRNIWDYFEEVDSVAPTGQKGVSSWFDF